MLLGLCLFALYNANGREIGSVDSQPTKYTAAELLRRGTLTLNHVVGAHPELASRPAFVRDAHGRYWSAYPPVPGIAAAALAWPLVRVGAIRLEDPMSPAMIAVIASSALTAFAVAVCFLTARRVLSRGRALVLAIALGAGTGWWPTVSQTLWQHECAIAGLSVAIAALCGGIDTSRGAALAGAGLAFAVTSRLQLAPAVVVLLCAVCARGGRRSATIAVLTVAAAASALAAFNLAATGHVLGGLPALEAMHPRVHATSGSFGAGLEGYAGLLVSPSRGLLLYSPIVAVAAAGMTSSDAAWRSLTRWCGFAALSQFALYGSYSVWWAGHTYGPRYMLDLLPLLVPAAAVAAGRFRIASAAGCAAIVALAWSIAVSALGAFVYPNERWNTNPLDVDRYHERLWDWRDNQIRRAWRSPPSPRNFMLLRSSTRQAK